jgi:hypothetical protein
VIYAPMGDARPYQAPDAIGKGATTAYYVRIGPETHMAKGAVLTQLHQLTARVPFDERRRSDVPLASVSPRLLARYLHDVGSDLAADPDTIDVRDVLRRLRLSGGLNGTEGPRNAALLFFTEFPEDIVPGCRIELAQFRDDAGGDLIETRAFRGPIQQQIASRIQTDPRALHEWAQTKIALARNIPPADDVAPAAKQQLLRESLDMLARVTELTRDQPVRAAWAWFDIAKVRELLQEPRASIEEAVARAIDLNPGEPKFQKWRQQRASRPT